MVDYKTLRKLRLGGACDTLALTLVAVSVCASHPSLNGIGPNSILFPIKAVSSGQFSLISAFVGGFMLAHRVTESLRNGLGNYFGSSIRIKSAKTEVIADDEYRFLLGYTVDGAQPVYAGYDDVVRHMAIVGQSGVGKTVFGQNLMFQQIGMGGGLVFIDGKLDSNALNELHLLAAYWGRQNDIMVINPGDANNSNTYNPILYGDPDEVADRIVSLIPSTESDAGADHFKQAAKQGCTVLVAALQRTKLAYTFIDLVILLTSPTHLMALESTVPLSDEKTNLGIFLDQYKVPTKDGQKTIDMKRLKETFGGIGGRLFTFGTGEFGRVMNKVSPEINLYEAMRSNKIIYVMLPTMGKAQTASNFGKMFLGDARTAFSWLQKLPDASKPNPPLLFFMDEVGSYATESLSRPFEQVRSARVILAPAFQTIANLEAVSPEFLQMVMGNTWIKVYFKTGTHETAEFAADSIGEEKQVQDSLSMVGGESSSSSVGSVSPSENSSSNENTGFGERVGEGYKVSPADLKALEMGEAIITIGGAKIYHVKVPMLSFEKDFVAQHGFFHVNRFKTKRANGVDLFNSAKNYFKKSQDDLYEANKANKANKAGQPPQPEGGSLEEQ